MWHQMWEYVWKHILILFALDPKLVPKSEV
jgi:hypothetical protein